MVLSDCLRLIAAAEHGASRQVFDSFAKNLSECIFPTERSGAPAERARRYRRNQRWLAHHAPVRRMNAAPGDRTRPLQFDRNCVEHARRDAVFAAERRLVRLRRVTLGLNPRVPLALRRAVECGHRVKRLGVAGRQAGSCLRCDCIRPPTPAGSCDCANRIDKKMQSKPVHTDVIGVTHGSPQLT